jgi:hypothetical protein
MDAMLDQPRGDRFGVAGGVWWNVSGVPADPYGNLARATSRRLAAAAARLADPEQAQDGAA